MSWLNTGPPLFSPQWFNPISSSLDYSPVAGPEQTTDGEQREAGGEEDY